ncbi:MAG: T9SS type A sorting domain-containing protein [Bacteroidales bacterium]|jgi:hypothetical protein|nr:T9SS type A sorting domain-containing protein [Bacteroidales bacterium]
MKKVIPILFLAVNICLSAQQLPEELDLKNKGYYELKVEFKAHNGTSHDATCSSQIRVKAYFKNNSQKIIYQRWFQMVGGASTSGSFTYVFPADNEIDKLEVWTERDYGNCNGENHGTTWFNNITYPYFFAPHSGMPGYSSESYINVSVSPLTNRRLLRLSISFTADETHMLSSNSQLYVTYSNTGNENIQFKNYLSYYVKNQPYGDTVSFTHSTLDKISEINLNLKGRAANENYDFKWINPTQTDHNQTDHKGTYTEKYAAGGINFNLIVGIDYDVAYAPIEYSGKEKILTPDNSVQLTSKGKFSTSVAASHRWVYFCGEEPSNNMNLWTPFPPSLQNKDEIKFMGSDLFGNDLTMINKKVHFRYYLGDEKDRYSSTVTVQYKRDAPRMSLYSKTNPTCSYTEDGSITIQFSRKLDDDEQLNLVVHIGSKTIPVVNLKTLEANNRLTFTGLSSGEVSVGSYVVKVGNESESTDGDGYALNNITLTAPSPVIGTFEKQDVNCYGGNDGRISITPSGGIGSYYAVYGEDTTSLFTSSGYVIHRFSPGPHQIKLFDSNHCHIGNDGDEATLTISQPAAPVVLNTERIFQPRGWGLSDGWIKVRAQNGTPPPDGDYTFYWTKQDAGSIPAPSPVTEGNSMTSTAENLGDGRYHIRVEDILYGTAVSLPGAVASDWKGCVAELDTVLMQPPKLEVTLATRDSISCFGLEDGAVMAHTRGGVGGPGTYEYEWVRKEGLSGVPISGGFVPDSILQDLLSATYVVTVRDTNGITTTAGYYLEQPELLTAAIAAATLACDGDTDGWIEAGVSGGTTPYQYVWTGYGTENATLRTTRIEGLTGGTYTLFVRDHRGCEAWSAGRVNVPGGMQLDTLIIPPVCHDASDGSIVLNVSGGMAPYTYLWNTPAATSALSNLPSGNYSVKVTDANNCFIEQRFSLKNPEPLRIDLGGDRVLCKDQTAVLSAKISDTNATYRWYNRDGLFAGEPEVEISGEGKYRVLVSDRDGCFGTDTVNISTRDMEIVADFVVAAKAAATIPTCFVNISHPFPESTEWMIPDETSVFIVSHTDEQLELLFNREGEYTVGLLARVGECEQAIYKTVTVVNKYDLTDYEPQQEAFLKQFKLWPNPSNGQFTVSVELSETADIQLRLISSAGTVMETRSLSGNDRYQENFSSNGKLQPGVYIIQLVSKKAVAAIQIVMENL